MDGVAIEGKSKQRFARLVLGPAGSVAQFGIERQDGPAAQQHLVALPRGPACPSAAGTPGANTNTGDASPPPAVASAVTSAVMSESSCDSLSSELSEGFEPPAAPPAGGAAGAAGGIGVKCEAAADGRFVVAGVKPGGAAERGGIAPGDTILEARARTRRPGPLPEGACVAACAEPDGARPAHSPSEPNGPRAG